MDSILRAAVASIKEKPLMTAAEKAWSIKWMADKNEPLWRISEAARMLAMQLDEANHD